MRMVSEQCTVLVEKSLLPKFMSDRIKDGWQVQSTQDGPAQKDTKKEVEVEVRMFKQYDINAPGIGR